MPASKQSPLAPGKPRDLEHQTSAERKAALRQARVWQPIETASLDLFAGPRGEETFAFDQHVTCEYSAPEGGQTGMTPKFDCTWKPDDVVKVKYGRKNGEVYAEVAATRLFWSLGFKADRMYPTRVTCQGCPTDPFAASKADWHMGKPGEVGRYVFDPAAVQRSLPGSAIETDGFEGWAWPELDKTHPGTGGAPRAHVDALKLLAVFVQHSDTKPEQQ